ncbi:hypothetical protein ES705_42488 [subsurface metagenome]
MNETKRTLKEKKFIEAYIEHQGNLTQAYLKISPGCKISSARVLGYRWLQKVNIPAQELLDRLNLNDVILVKKLKEGLEATKKVAGFDVPDHNVRVRYLDMALKLKNAYPAEKRKPEEERRVIVIGADAKEEFIEKIDDMAKKHEIEMENWTDEEWLDYIKEVRARKEEREREESKNDDDTQKGGGAE